MASTAVIKGLALAASFLTTGSLATITLISIPTTLAIADHDSTTATTLAKQFEVIYRVGKISLLPLEVLSIATFSALSWQTRTVNASTWKLYASAAVSMFAVVPWTLATMERNSQKIISLATSSDTHAADTEPKLDHSDGTAEKPSSSHLGVPDSGHAAQLVITPVEEFEPYEDALFTGAEYEKFKIVKLLQIWNVRNTVRVYCAGLAATLGLYATLRDA